VTAHHTCHDSDARELAERAWDGASEAVITSLRAEKSVDVLLGQVLLTKWILTGIGGVVIGMFAWVVAEVRSQAAVARASAELVAETTVLKADRRLDDRLALVAKDAAESAIRLRDAQIDRVAAKAP
jgi:hypothetical protein